MAKYTTRTCSNCGIRKPQPEMHQQEVHVETGKSKSGVSGATWAGLLLGDKKSANSINRWLFNTNQRTYTRKKTVWLCGSCARGGKAGEAVFKFVEFLVSAIVVIAVLSFMYGIVGIPTP